MVWDEQERVCRSTDVEAGVVVRQQQQAGAMVMTTEREEEEDVAVINGGGAGGCVTSTTSQPIISNEDTPNSNNTDHPDVLIIEEDDDNNDDTVAVTAAAPKDSKADDNNNDNNEREMIGGGGEGEDEEEESHTQQSSTQNGDQEEEEDPPAATTKVSGGRQQHQHQRKHRDCQVVKSSSSSSSQSNKSSASSPSPLKDYTNREYMFMISAGLLLSFNAGFVNGSSLSGLLTPSGLRQSVAGFTGTYTVSALSLADGRIDIFGRLVSMFLSFTAGACIAGFLSPRASPYRIHPTYAPTFMIGGAFLAVGSILAAFEAWDDHCFFFVAAANGIQNGISSLYSANLIRSTHLTGTSTDIGLFLGQLLRGNTKNLWKLKVLVGLASSFWTGGLISFYATTAFTSRTLLFNAVLFAVIATWLTVFLIRNLEITAYQALTGTWHWKVALYKFDIIGHGGVDEKRAMEVFDRVDVDRSGQIDDGELCKALRDVGVPGASLRMARTMIGIVDEDENGQISRNEWRNLVLGKKKQEDHHHREQQQQQECCDV